jgi:quercetin dioxygenase-like cupin family protein
MGLVRGAPYEPMVGDPDDHRPRTTWRVVVDAPMPGARAVDGAVLLERCAVGDRIPLHRHDVDEIVTILDGHAEYHLDGKRHDVGTGDIVFIPAGSVHGTVNTGDVPLHLHAAFDRTRVRMEMLERNPAPGTEQQAPMTTVYDFSSGEVTVEGPTPT